MVVAAVNRKGRMRRKQRGMEEERLKLIFPT